MDCVGIVSTVNGLVVVPSVGILVITCGVVVSFTVVVVIVLVAVLASEAVGVVVSVSTTTVVVTTDIGVVCAELELDCVVNDGVVADGVVNNGVVSTTVVVFVVSLLIGTVVVNSLPHPKTSTLIAGSDSAVDPTFNLTMFVFTGYLRTIL